MRSAAITAILIVLLLSLAGVAGAQSISTSVTQQDGSIIFEVRQDGEPVSGASVSISSLGNNTSVDGNYVTNSEGRVVLGEDQLENLSGVVHLRVDIQAGNSYRSELVTITRSPDLEENAPLGQRLSMSLERGVASTRGTIQGNVFITRVESVGTDENKIEILRDHAVELMRNISDRNLRQKTLGRRLATGQVSPIEYYMQTVENMAHIETLRSDLELTLRRLDRFNTSTLRDNGIASGAVYDLYRDLREGREIPTNPSVLLRNE